MNDSQAAVKELIVAWDRIEKWVSAALPNATPEVKFSVCESIMNDQLFKKNK